MNDDSPFLEGAEEVSVAGFNRHIGPLYRLADVAPGLTRRFGFVVADKHMNASGSVHGGMMMAFMDFAMSQSARMVSDGNSCNTVSLNCDFVGPGRLGDAVEALVRVTRRSRTMVFLSGELIAGKRALLVANGLWKIVADK